MEDPQEISKTEIGDRRTLPKLETFGLVTGIIGLVADTIGLVTFAAGLWSFESGSSLDSSRYALFIVVTVLALVYGWLMSAWVITRQALNRFPEPPDRESLDDTAIRSTTGVGLVLVPLAIIWFAITFSGTGAPSQPPIPITATPTIAPTVSKDSDLTAPLPDAPPSTQMDHTTNVVIGTVMAMAFLYPLTGLGIWGCQVLIMPLVYSDLPQGDVILTEHRECIKTDIDKNWNEWEDRISIELDRYNWITVNKLQDRAELLEVPLECLEIAFAKYASLHSTGVRYGYLHNDGGFMVSDYRVLVNSDYDLEEWYMD